ncbi:hypothetical protein Nepgr_010125 [Nepenthes gracilis]|uniref:Uncharacterized protein n=1 Tax=Nepenthes gracilis TaxID=150966 RepID=A0AAD3SBV2_NEPGR|nr:hypothetical protein Nepgr_010125 [Nepenthes gracilis]
MVADGIARIGMRMNIDHQEQSHEHRSLVRGFRRQTGISLGVQAPSRARHRLLRLPPTLRYRNRSLPVTDSLSHTTRFKTKSAAKKGVKTR